MKINTAISALFLLLSAIFSPVSALTVHTIGDSTMPDYEESTTDKR